MGLPENFTLTMCTACNILRECLPHPQPHQHIHKSVTHTSGSIVLPIPPTVPTHFKLQRDNPRENVHACDQILIMVTFPKNTQKWLYGDLIGDWGVTGRMMHPLPPPVYDLETRSSIFSCKGRKKPWPSTPFAWPCIAPSPANASLVVKNKIDAYTHVMGDPPHSTLA